MSHIKSLWKSTRSRRGPFGILAICTVSEAVVGMGRERLTSSSIIVALIANICSDTPDGPSMKCRFQVECTEKEWHINRYIAHQ